MTTVTARDFERDPGRYERAAMHEPVTITTAGREQLVLLSAEEYQRLRRIEDVLAGREKPSSPDDDPLAQLFDRLHAKVQADGLTADEVDAELDAYNAENRH
jgi:prevent-host-death family protein